jgi:hypothetical protein
MFTSGNIDDVIHEGVLDMNNIAIYWWINQDIDDNDVDVLWDSF